ncbi:aminotransferase [Sphingomonas sp. FW199]|uniref:aminotransferase n=1 Tax=Sphingomonas sp. FW199 TaxID=3400217 RepID=UPI003CEB8676
MNPVFASLDTTIFEAMSARARETRAINLGQGFPEEDGCPAVIAAAAAALTGQSNQYPPMPGLPVLRDAVAGWYNDTQGTDIAAQEVIVTSGATEALAAAILALVSPGDQVVLVQPLYDAYLPLVQRAGGDARLITLAPPDWRLTREMLDAVADRPRFILLNDPVNPTGAMMDDATRAMIARWCVEHDVIAICDEVWEGVTFDGRRHRPLMTEAGMRERTVKIGSAGKLFALTGWKVGWLCAAPALSSVLAKAHQFITFTTPPALQWGVAHGLTHERGWIEGMATDLQRSRDRLASGLAQAGFITTPSAGTYFLSVDLPASGIAMGDVEFSEWAIDHAGVASIPLSAFFAADPVTTHVRLCFAKSDATLDAAIERLAKARALA